MTGSDLEKARHKLGLTAAALGRALELEGRDPGQQVRRWETGANALPGPVRVAVRYMLAEAKATRLKARQEAEGERIAAELNASGFIDLGAPPRPLKARRRG